MFEKFRNNIAKTAKELPKEERASFVSGVQNAPAKEGELNTYGKAKEEHLQQAEIKQEVWAEKLEQQKQDTEKKATIEKKVAEITSSITELKKLGINTDVIEKELNTLLNPEPENTIEIAGKKIEIGPYLGKLNWKTMNEELDKLNKTLKSGEKEWRVLTKKEYKELGKAIQEIRADKGLSDDEKRAKVAKYVKSLGFAPDRDYWSSTEAADDKDGAWHWYTSSGNVYDYYKSYKLSVQCVRQHFGIVLVTADFP